MALTRRGLLGAAAGLAALPRARAQQPAIRFGVLGDQSGPYRDFSGPVSVACTRQAIADFGTAAKGMTVEVLVGDHQNKPDVGAGIARRWFDEDGVDVILDVPNSAVALAVSAVARDKDKVFMVSGAGTADLTGPQCTPNTCHMSYDTWMLAHATGGAMVKAGGDSWFFITADYAFGHALQRDTANCVKAAGGKVLGNVDTPFPGTTDFSSYLVQAQASGAKVIGLANAGADTINCIKQAAEFGVSKTAKMAGLLVYISDVHSLGLPTAQGLVLSATFYWDLNARTRALTKRLLPNTNGQCPGMSQAGCYASALHYLKVAADMGVARAKASGRAAVARMKAMPMDDDVFGHGSIREDGLAIHPAYLFEVKKPAESTGPWDYYKLLATVPAEQAFKPLAETGCKLVHA
ncbi:MAG: ABC transporter substrate-binding protein [Alphaproteobacteria bacterium]|nr:ABC transporter substrate-binding protein [Alphaproteobacteria bacterium]